AMQLLSLLALPLVAATGYYGQPVASPPAYSSYSSYPVAAAAPSYGAYAASPIIFPGWGGRRTLEDEFQGPKIRAPISNPFFVPRYRGERHLHRGDYGSRWGSAFSNGHHHHHHGYFGGDVSRHHHHHHAHLHAPQVVPQYFAQPVYQAPPVYAQQPAYPVPAAVPGGY
ncbi:hypothetical protein PMAYCL1PPCAC_30527, partial [Pristionchus mayeri]